jgi:predicted cupin superfamily sugar epimerase
MATAKQIIEMLSLKPHSNCGFVAEHGQLNLSKNCVRGELFS